MMVVLAELEGVITTVYDPLGWSWEAYTEITWDVDAPPPLEAVWEISDRDFRIPIARKVVTRIPGVHGELGDTVKFEDLCVDWRRGQLIAEE